MTHPPAPTEPGRGGLAAIFIAAVWLGLLVTDLAYVGKYGPPVFHADDWEFAPALAGRQPVTPAWLWSQHNEHRIPLPRLLLLGLFGASGNNLRAGMFFNVAALGVLALALAATAGKVRGRAAWTEAFFPVALLHPGHWENFVLNFQVQLVVSTALAALVLMAVVWDSAPLNWPRALLAGGGLLLLPLCGANGVLVAIPLAAWLALEAAVLCRLRRARAGFLVGAALATLGAAGLYCWGWTWPADHPPAAGPLPTLRCTLEALGHSLGGPLWLWPAWGTVAVILVALAVRVLIRTVLARPGERSRGLGLLLFLGSFVLLALSIGRGRSGFGPGAGLSWRYVTLLAPLGCCLYFVGLLYGRGTPLRFGPVMLIGAAATALAFGAPAAVLGGEERRQQVDPFARAVRSGLPAWYLAERYTGHPFHIYPPAKRGLCVSYLEMLRDAGVAPFQSVPREDGFRTVAVAAEAATPAGGSYLLDEPRFVWAVRIRYAHRPTRLPVLFEVAWAPAPALGPTEAAGRGQVVLLPQEHEAALVWVGDTVRQLWVFRDNNPGVTVERVELLVPAGR